MAELDILKLLADAFGGGGGGPFDPEGDGYDYDRARASGMRPGPDGHWGTVAPTTEEERKKYNFPADSYIVLKGRKHKTWDLGVQGEEDRNAYVTKRGNRYYSLPKD